MQSLPVPVSSWARTENTGLQLIVLHWPEAKGHDRRYFYIHKALYFSCFISPVIPNLTVGGKVPTCSLCQHSITCSCLFIRGVESFQTESFTQQLQRPDGCQNKLLLCDPSTKILTFLSFVSINKWCNTCRKLGSSSEDRFPNIDPLTVLIVWKESAGVLFFLFYMVNLQCIVIGLSVHSFHCLANFDFFHL